MLAWSKNVLNKIEKIGFSKLNKTDWPYLEPRFLQLTNLVAFIGAAISLTQSILELIGGQIFYGLSDLAGGLLMLFTMALNAMGCFNASRIFILLVLSLDVYYFSLLSNFTAGLSLMYFIFLLFSFFLFSSKEKFCLILTSLIPFCFYILENFYRSFNLIPKVYQSPAPEWYGIAVPIIAFPITFFVIYRFLKVTEEMQIKVVHQSKLSSLGEMAAGISHEINNPLTSIILNTGLLKQDLAKGEISLEKVFSRISKIELSSERAAKIISGLSLLSRDSAAEPQLVFNLNDCIAETIQLTHERFIANKINFIDQIENPSIMVKGNSVQISQVLINLLNNAHDAVKDFTQREKWIRLEVKQTNRWVEVRVVDSGDGISAKNQKRIMEPFFTTKIAGEGVGLGLSISKGFAEAHHGMLMLESEAKNTTFVLRLPVALE